MSEQKTVDTMTTEELNTALQSDLDQLDGKVQAEPEKAPETEPEPDKKPEEQEPDNSGDQPPADKKPGEEGEGEGDDEGSPYRKRIDRLLRKRDDLQETVAEKEARIAALEAENAKLKGGKTEEDEQPKPEKDISEVINKVLDDRDSKSKTASEKQKAKDQEFDNLVKKVPNAVKRKAEILELADQYPTLTFEALDRILSPADHIDPIEVNRKNAKRMDVSARSRADLQTEKDMTKATPAEQEKYLREEQAAGRLVI